jgi:hypothetical protein
MSKDEVGRKALGALIYHFSTPELSICAVFVTGLILVLTDPQGTKDDDYSKRRDYALTLTSRWLSFRRSPTQIQRILTTDCNCSQSDRESHMHMIGAVASEPKLNPGRTPGELLIYGCTAAIRNAREPNTATRYKLHHFPRRKKWPYSTEQVLPHGAEQTVCGYLDWLVTDDAAIFHKIMEAFAVPTEYTWSLISPAIIKKHLFLDHFIHVATRWKDYGRQLALERAIDNNNSVPRVLGILLQLSIVLWTIIPGCSDHTATTFFLHDQHEEVLISCDQMIRTVSSIVQQIYTKECVMLSNQTRTYLSLIGTSIYNHFPECRPRTAHLSSHKIFLKDAHPLDVPHILPWSTLNDSLTYYRIRQRCTAPGCTRTPEHTKKPLRYCMGCRRIPYCSRDCQKRAWIRKDGIQHRGICGLIRYICSLHNLPQTSKSTMISLHVPSLSEKEALVVDTINKHFAMLTLHDIQT